MTRKVSWGVLGVAKIGIEKVIPAMQRGERLARRRDRLARHRQGARGAADAARHRQGLRLLRGAARRSRDRGDLQSAAQRAARPLDDPRAGGRQARACARSRSRSTPTEARRADRGAPARPASSSPRPSWCASTRNGGARARSRVRARSATSRAIQTFFSYRLLDAEQHPQPAAGRRRALRHRLLRDPHRALRLRRRADARRRRRSTSIPHFGTDRLASALIEFPGGRHLTFTCATQLSAHQRVTIVGETGRVEIAIPFNAPIDRPTRIVDRQRRRSRRRRRARRGIPRLRPIYAAGRRLLARGSRRGAAGIPHRGRDRQHARDRRRLPLGAQRRLGEAVRARRPSSAAANRPGAARRLPFPPRAWQYAVPTDWDPQPCPTPSRAARRRRPGPLSGRTRTTPTASPGVDDYAWIRADNWREVLRDPAALPADIRALLRGGERLCRRDSRPDPRLAKAARARDARAAEGGRQRGSAVGRPLRLLFALPSRRPAPDLLPPAARAAARRRSCSTATSAPTPSRSFT